MVWRGKDLSPGGHHLDNEVLMFKNFSKDNDAGTYMCRYDNKGKTIDTSVVVAQKRKNRYLVCFNSLFVIIFFYKTLIDNR